MASIDEGTRSHKHGYPGDSVHNQHIKPLATPKTDLRDGCEHLKEHHREHEGAHIVRKE